jgi:hypothetical protein
MEAQLGFEIPILTLQATEAGIGPQVYVWVADDLQLACVQYVPGNQFLSGNVHES